MTGIHGSNDLEISRIIKAPPALLWDARVDPDSLAQWWLPAPHRCKVVTLDIRPGGGFETLMSDGEDFKPHLDACFLDVEWGRKLIFTNVLSAGWRPTSEPFIAISAIISFNDHPDGTDYRARVFHRSASERDRHEHMGFFDGWGTCINQLQILAEGRLH